MTLRTRSANLGGTLINTNAIVLATGVNITNQINAAYTQANAAYSQANTGGGPKITSLVYPGDDLAANTVGGQTVYVVGSGFASNAAVYINGNSAPSVSYISAGNLSITTPALSTGTYPVYVINPADGGTAISIPGLVVSGEPSWNTAASLSTNQAADSVWNYTLSANGDAPITYTLAAGSSLPSGISLAANGLISGTMSSPPINTTVYTFSVIASDAQLQDSTRQFTVTVTTGEGVLFANTVLLLHADGTNNGNNHAFVDSSSNNYSITRNGNATQGTFSPFSQTGWSAYFDGTGDYLTIPSSAPLTLGTSDFTIEFWWYPLQFSSDGELFGARNGSSLCFAMYTFGNNGSLAAYAGSGSSSWDIVSNLNMGTAIRHTWNHIAFTRSGNTFRTYLNGAQISSTTSSGSLGGTTVQISGRDANGTAMAPESYISNCRILKGTAAYTGSTYTVPTAPFTAVANTSLLTLQSNRFIDNSTNAFTITRNGDVSIQAFSPFAPTDSYTTANVGGSVYVGGSGNWLSFGTQTAFDCGTSTQFCMETWVYPPTSFPNGIHFWGAHQAGVPDGFYFTSSGLNAYSGGSGGAGVNTNKSPTIGAWNHCVVTRDAGGRLRYFVNGELTGTSTSSIQVNTDNRAVGINGGINFNGDLCYQSQSRYIKGSIPTTYQTSSTTVGAQIFTPPTAPLTTTSQGANSSHVIALLNYTNAQIFDQTGKNVLECIGDAKVSTSVYKYGSGSIVFDGSGDRLTIPYTNSFLDLGINGEKFTIEAWIYPTNTMASAGQIISKGGGNASWSVTNGAQYQFTVSSGAISWNFNSSGSAVSVGCGNATLNAWQHVAVTYDGTTTKTFLNGVQQGTSTSGYTAPTTRNLQYIGMTQSGGYTQEYYGYIDDFRITKGYARYTSNFTPPTVAFPNK